jgi:pullulanase
VCDILRRRQTHFVLWCPAKASSPPGLIIGRIRNGNPPTFQQLARKTLQQAVDAGGPIGHWVAILVQYLDRIDGLWELEASTLGLTDGETYHYWFEVDDRSPVAFRRLIRWLRRWTTGCTLPPTPRSCIRRR